MYEPNDVINSLSTPFNLLDWLISAFDIFNDTSIVKVGQHYYIIDFESQVFN